MDDDTLTVDGNQCRRSAQVNTDIAREYAQKRAQRIQHRGFPSFGLLCSGSGIIP